MVSDSVVDERTLREIYLTAFEIVVRESSPLAIMTSYNRVNGTYAHENAHLLTEILREEWGFAGAVITDWGGGNDAVAALEAGGTLEMPSPGLGFRARDCGRNRGRWAEPRHSRRPRRRDADAHDRIDPGRASEVDLEAHHHTRAPCGPRERRASQER